jgi:glycosyltransferase 2 family protein
VPRSPWIRAAQLLLGLAIVWFAARALVSNWDQLRAQPLKWQIAPGWILASAVIVWLMYAILIAAWRALLAGWGQRIDYWTAARIWVVSNLGKYLPGKVWAVAGMALMSQQAGVAPWAATGSAVILQLLSIGTGAAIVGLTGAGALETAHPGARLALWLLLAASLGGVLLLFWPPVLERVLALALPAAGRRTSPPVRELGFGIIANLLAWLGYGIALLLLARGFLPDVGLRLQPAVAVFTASYLAGFLALLVPGGIGVREGVFILMLQGPLGIGAATALALASRVLLTITELGAAVPFLVFPRRNTRVAI